MKLPNSRSGRRHLWIGAALLSIAFHADALAQKYCSTENTGSDYSAVQNIYQSNGACHDNCSGYAFAVVQYQSCWCSNYLPADQISVDGNCNQNCPGYPDEKCGDGDNGHYGYIALGPEPSGTAGGSTTSPTSSSKESSPSPAEQSSSEDPETSYVSKTVVETVTQTQRPSVITYLVTPTSATTHRPTPTISASTPAPTSALPRTTAKPTVIVQTVSGNIVTRVITSIASATTSPTIVDIPEKASKTNAATIAGIVLGVIFGIILLGVALLFLYRRRRNSHDSEKSRGSDNNSKIMTRNVSVLSKAGLLTRGNRQSMGDRDHDEYYTSAPGNAHSMRNSVMFGAGGVSPTSPLDSSHSADSQRLSKPMVYDQRLNPSALFANQEANGSRISMQDQQDYSRPLGVVNPDVRPSFESRTSHAVP